MTNAPDPSLYRDREKQFFEHARHLLDDDRLRLDTRQGRRPLLSTFVYKREGESGVERGERAKRLMLELGVADRELQHKLPVGERLDVTLKMRNFWMLKKTVGELTVLCASPTRDLVLGQSPAPMGAAEVGSRLADLKRSAGGPDVPVTIVLMSTSGFTQEAKALATRSGARALLLVEPNDAGGWAVHAPPDCRELADLLDPEQQSSKFNRVRGFIDENRFDLLQGGIAAEKIAARTQLPIQTVEAALKSYARENPGLAARSIDGRLMLYREGSSVSSSADDPGGSNMPFWETIKGIFKREESTDRKIARLSGERASLSAQRERAYDEIASVEKRESELTKSFKEATALAQRRIATEISQLRKDIERRQQILGAIDKKINVINTGIHTLELQNHVSPEKLKALENVAASSEEVEAGMAALQQLDEEANASAGIGASDVPDDVQAILEELRGKSETPAETNTGATTPTERVSTSGESGGRSREPAAPTTPASERRRSEPEAG
jgi:hypothetical protein